MWLEVIPLFTHDSIFDFHLFADDSNLFYSDKDLQHLEETINRELGEINIWLCANKLSLNIDKTHFVVFHPYQKKLNYAMKIEIDGKTLNQYKSVKYLGILIDCHLNWKEHIRQLSKNIGTQSVQELFFCDRSICKTVCSNDLVKCTV